VLKFIYTILASIILAILLGSCATLTRTEEDIYTLTDIDTAITYHWVNAPGTRDNGVIFPSSKVIVPEREIIQRDSIVERYYPDFIRFGFFESVGIIGGNSDNSIGTGLFGIFPEFDKLSDSYRGGDHLFTGGIYRLGILEHRLRWFRDSKNWTIGTHGLEFLIPDSRGERMLFSVLPVYLRKRYYLREDIPYLSVTPSLGIGLYPSLYLNLSGSLELGSIGGLNLRAYIGVAAGYNSPGTPQVKNNDYMNESSGQSSIFPYFGLGISFLDFHNLVRETEKEWKYYEHSAWNIGLLQFAIINGSSEESIYSGNSLFTGFQLKLANASLAILHRNNHFFLGTSLMNLIVAGQNSWGMGILPIRGGYWFIVAEDELSAEPFLEASYYPSAFVNIGTKVNLAISESINIGLIIGYINGSTSFKLPVDFNNNFGINKDLSSLYMGINFGLLDRIFFREELRYYK
jgi:hypothetical protein